MRPSRVTFASSKARRQRPRKSVKPRTWPLPRGRGWCPPPRSSRRRPRSQPQTPIGTRFEGAATSSPQNRGMPIRGCRRRMSPVCEARRNRIRRLRPCRASDRQLRRIQARNPPPCQATAGARVLHGTGFAKFPSDGIAPRLERGPGSRRRHSSRPSLPTLRAGLMLNLSHQTTGSWQAPVVCDVAAARRRDRRQLVGRLGQRRTLEGRRSPRSRLAAPVLTSKRTRQPEAPRGAPHSRMQPLAHGQ
mmetsp:Transcript_11096/g.34398  ORF Transcript_11096/g.34398 Transcript_11096/m.34398 type:complete len:247 (-) Transcript_11096:1307-2047(-)